MKEKVVHKRIYGILEIDEENCTHCGKCLTACPIQRIVKIDDKYSMNNTQRECIHCFSCVEACSRDAISFTNRDEGWAKIERIYKKVAKEGSFFRSEETPRSAVYPLR